MTIQPFLAGEQICDGNGDPLPGAKLYHYLAGTTTPLTLYSDKAGQTPTTNPIVCDGDGFAPLYYLPDRPWKVVVKDANEVTKHTYDDLGNPAGQFRERTVQAISSSGAALSIDLDQGEWIRLSLGHNVTSIAFTNWPVSGLMGRCVFELRNTGAFSLTGWPAAVKWTIAGAPIVTSGSGKKDLFVFVTSDGGTTIYGSVVGQDFAY